MLPLLVLGVDAPDADDDASEDAPLDVVEDADDADADDDVEAADDPKPGLSWPENPRPALPPFCFPLLNLALRNQEDFIAWKIHQHSHN